MAMKQGTRTRRHSGTVMSAGIRDTPHVSASNTTWGHDLASLRVGFENGVRGRARMQYVEGGDLAQTDGAEEFETVKCNVKCNVNARTTSRAGLYSL